MFYKMAKIKVVWVCTFSNSEVRAHLKREVSPAIRLKRRLFHEPPIHIDSQGDYALWNTRGIDEFKNFKEIELHVIAAASHLASSSQEFVSDGIHYYFYRDDVDMISNRLKGIVCRERQYLHVKAIEYINKTIDKIKPEIIHLIGAENPYSAFVLTRPKGIPIIVHLQTLLSEPGFKEGYPLMSEASYNFRSKVERDVLLRCEYIGTESEKFKNYILEKIKPEAKIFNMDLATGLTIPSDIVPKEFDFVYFAKDIKKAADFAIEAFAITLQKYPNLTLDVIGHYNADFKSQLDIRIKELGIGDNITFEGSFPSHEDVVKQVRKSRFALLPFKIDYSPTTIPEAMSLGLPVVSTRTDGIKTIYKEDVNILLSDVGDHISLSRNMIRLMEERGLADKIMNNAYSFIRSDDNTARMRRWVEVYRTILT